MKSQGNKTKKKKKPAVAKKAATPKTAPRTGAAHLDALVAAAMHGRDRAYAPYSRYRVGAAVLADNGKTYIAANVENASYGLSICAERNAVSAAILDGANRILACAVVTASDPPAAPCGTCRQTLNEFAPRRPAEMPLALANPEGRRRNTRLSALLPWAFRPEDLG